MVNKRSAAAEQVLDKPAACRPYYLMQVRPQPNQFQVSLIFAISSGFSHDRRFGNETVTTTPPSISDRSEA
jgi:hypothetical protein